MEKGEDIGVSKLSPQDKQALRDITKTHLESCIAGDWKVSADTLNDAPL